MLFLLSVHMYTCSACLFYLSLHIHFPALALALACVFVLCNPCQSVVTAIVMNFNVIFVGTYSNQLDRHNTIRQSGRLTFHISMEWQESVFKQTTTKQHNTNW